MKPYFDTFIVWLAKKPAIVKTINYLVEHQAIEFLFLYVSVILSFSIGMIFMDVMLRTFGRVWPGWISIPVLVCTALIAYALQNLSRDINK